MFHRAEDRGLGDFGEARHKTVAARGPRPRATHPALIIESSGAAKRKFDRGNSAALRSGAARRPAARPPRPHAWRTRRGPRRACAPIRAARRRASPRNRRSSRSDRRHPPRAKRGRDLELGAEAFLGLHRRKIEFRHSCRSSIKRRRGFKIERPEPAPMRRIRRYRSPRRGASPLCRPAASSAATSRPGNGSAFRLWRSILRRWPKAAFATCDNSFGSQGSGEGFGNELHHRGGDLGRRRESRGREIEQDARARPPAAEHGEPAIIGALRRRRDDALGDLALEHQHIAIEDGRPGLRLDPARQQLGGDIIGKIGADARRPAEPMQPRTARPDRPRARRPRR